MKNLTLLHRNLPLRWRYGLAIVIFAVGLLLRFLILPVNAGFPFITLYPATVAALYFCGTGPGLLVIACSVMAAYNIFIPRQHLPLFGREYIIIGIYLFGATAMAIVVRQLQHHTKTLYETVAKLKDSEKLFRSFMDNSNLIAWMKDEQGRYVFLSKPSEQRFQIPADSWNGRTDEDIFPPALAQQLRRNDSTALYTAHPIATEESAVSADGSTMHWLSSRFPYTDSAGKRYVGGIAIDITKRKPRKRKRKILRSTIL